ncbi:MAG: hypothetical protein FVQ81_18700, partial [Candidatus Glassbacteria bacterium]|nr:hypothetical protein [Candidatus Glassbacteria bacterium]
MTTVHSPPFVIAGYHHMQWARGILLQNEKTGMRRIVRVFPDDYSSPDGLDHIVLSDAALIHAMFKHAAQGMDGEENLITIHTPTP